MEFGRWGSRLLQRRRVEWRGIYLSRGPLEAIKDAPLGVCSSECGECKHKGIVSRSDCGRVQTEQTTVLLGVVV